MFMPVSRSSRWLLPAALCLIPSLLIAAERRKPTFKKGDFNPEHASVEMFEGMKSGQLDVKIIMLSSKEANVFIENKTKAPLNVQLPEAFTAVLAQGGFGADPFGGGGGNNQNQSAGGGMGGMGGGQGGGNNFFNVPAERVGEMEVPCVCLEHGKDDPNPRLEYKIQPFEAYSSDSRLREVLTLLGQRKVSQRVAQAASWHLANNMSWQELASKEIRRLNGQRYSYFNPLEMQGAVNLVQYATVQAKQKDKPTVEGQSLGDTVSQNP